MKVHEISEGKSAVEEEKLKKWIFIKIFLFLFFCWSLMQKWKNQQYFVPWKLFRFNIISRSSCEYTQW
jgi:hypothetical protein